MNRIGKSDIAALSTLTLMAAVSAGLSSAESEGEASASSSRQVKKFVPWQFRGRWTGTWNNLTFDTSGKAFIQLKVRGHRRRPVMFGVFRLGGEAFGCESTPPRPVRMTRGNGLNRWNGWGFRAGWPNGKGPIRITYNFRSRTIRGSGVSPCTSAVTYNFRGWMNQKRVRANTWIKLNGEPFATSRLVMNR